MVRITGVAEQGPQKHAVILQDFQFRMHRRAQALAESGPSVQLYANFLRVPALHPVVVSCHDSFLAREVVVGSPGRYPSGPRDVAHGGNFKTTSPEESQRRLQNYRLGLLAGALVYCPHDVGLILNMFKY